MIDKDQNNNLSAVDRKLEHFEAVNSKDFIINIDSMAIISYRRLLNRLEMFFRKSLSFAYI